MASFNVASGATDKIAQTVGADDGGMIEAGATLSATTAVTWTGGDTDPGVVIDNDGTISAKTRAIDTTSNFTTGSFTLINQADAQILAANNDAVRIDAALTSGTIDIDNYGLLVSGSVDKNGNIVAGASGQAIDLATIVSPDAVVNITNHAGGVIGSSGDDAIRPSAGHVTITNDGLIDATASANRAINLNTASLSDISEFHLINGVDGTIQSQGDAVRITATTLDTTATGVFTIDNAGVIKSTGVGSDNGQAIDFNDLVSPLAKSTITNEATGLIQAADADAIRGGVNTTIINLGKIVSMNGTPTSSGNDGVDFQDNAGGVIQNGNADDTTALISGARHGVTGNDPVTITNWGEILGNSGSGVNLDTAGTTTTQITNHGLIIGTSVTADGDGVDVDGLIALNNYGSIQATGVHVVDPVTGATILQEAVTVGGGVINNFQGGVITSFERAITVDNSNDGNAFGPTTILNEGLIHGGDGQAISITDTFADTLTNKGVIQGSIALGAGDDTLNLFVGSSITGVTDGGAGIDTAHLYGEGASNLSALVNFEALDVIGGVWTTTADESFANGVSIDAGASLVVASGALTANVADSGALLFDHADDVTYSSVVSGRGSVTQEGAGVLTLSGDNSYTGGTSIVSGVLDLASAQAAGTGVIRFEAGAGTLRIEAAAFTDGHLANTITGLGAQDSIDLSGFTSATSATLGANNLLTVRDNAGHVETLQLDPSQNFAGDVFKVMADGSGGTTISFAQAQQVGSGYTIGAGGGEVVALHGNNALFAGGAGADYIVMGDGTGGSANGGAGNDVIIAGAGKDALTGGTGADTLIGGSGLDTFIINKGDLADPTTDGGHYDTILDFKGAGVPGLGDMIRFQGFSSAATLTHVGDVAGAPDEHIYQVDDGAYHAQLIIEYAGGVGSNLKVGNYGFFG
ncbi:autotransporter-associated beta strand repeat-containing protein [Caulobacter sp. S45]|uniref:beta strand repeat-containing protein n=1 Tax=Caulobacter sp. S45 TaxID=1641861 RepID=UPI00131A70C6|nr:autotransporter-associated beta strand repeat-containing protein [Caulobacter sp. S45]